MLTDAPDNLDALGSSQGRLPPRVTKLLALLDRSGISAAILLDEGEALSTKVRHWCLCTSTLLLP